MKTYTEQEQKELKLLKRQADDKTQDFFDAAIEVIGELIDSAQECINRRTFLNAGIMNDMRDKFQKYNDDLSKPINSALEKRFKAQEYETALLIKESKALTEETDRLEKEVTLLKAEQQNSKQ